MSVVWIFHLQQSLSLGLCLIFVLSGSSCPSTTRETPASSDQRTWWRTRCFLTTSCKNKVVLVFSPKFSGGGAAGVRGELPVAGHRGAEGPGAGHQGPRQQGGGAAADQEDGRQQSGMPQSERGTPASHLNEQTRIIGGFNEIKADFLSQLVLVLDSIHPRL